MKKLRIKSIFIPIIFLFLTLYGCNPVSTIEAPISTIAPIPSTDPTISPETESRETFAEVEFRAEVPSSSDLNQTVSLDLLDEVTGLALNILRYEMKREDLIHYSLKIPLKIGSLIEYRYIRDQSPTVVEYNPLGKQVRYRLLHVKGNDLVTDVVSGWTDTPYQGEVGRIQGQITDAVSHLPVPNVLVNIGGLSTQTASDGSFLIEGVATGVHNLVAASLDGNYYPNSQGALIAAGATTPTPLSLVPTKTVKVTFLLHPPVDSLSGIPVRMVGNLHILGNTFAELQGGLSVIASRAPLLTANQDGTYSITLELPAGFDLRYKYTLGDGFWNAEHTSSGGFLLRQLIIPDHDISIEDFVETWQSGKASSASFTVQVPTNTPPDDIVSIQFNPYAWTPPIPMWPLGNGQWLYILYSPLDLLGNVGYRFCRNDQCGIADDAATMGANAQGPTISKLDEPQSILATVDTWVGWPDTNVTSNVVAVDISPRGANFIAGIEFESSYDPTWNGYLDNANKNIKDLGANWIFLTPGWTFLNNNPPVLGIVPGRNPSWNDSWEMIRKAKVSGQKVALFPVTQYGIQKETWWENGKRDDGWWKSWFDRYRTFLLNYADLAQEADVDAIILGEPGMYPALPEGKLANGKHSGISLDASLKWQKILDDMRGHYSGVIIWAIPYPFDIEAPYSFLKEVDGIYILYSAQLAKGNKPSQAEVTSRFKKTLESDIKPFIGKIKKPVYIGVIYPSADGAANGCLIKSEKNCLSLNNLTYTDYGQMSLHLDLQEQMDIYNGIFVAINQEMWIDGFISRGYYPPVILKDATSSIHGKPAADVLWYWFPRMLTEPN